MSLGIDFGTTRTVVAYADRGNYPVLSFLDAAGDSCDWYPSVIAERGGELRFGFDALAVADDPSWHFVRSFKRLLSDARAVPDTIVHVGELGLSIGDLLTRFLLSLREAIETRSNLKGKTSSRTVAAVPANAYGAQRFVTLDAFKRAGFEVVALLNEPSAAGFEYTHRHRDTLTPKKDHVVVYDLGGGTFDASLVRMNGLDHEVVMASGVHQLGGDDFDDVLADLIIAKAKLKPAKITARVRAKLLDSCRDAKERLNPSSRKMTIDLAAAGVAEGEATISVADYYAACAPLVEQSIEAMKPIMERTSWNDPAVSELAGIYVVGGASELPVISRTLRDRFGRKVHRSPYPSAAVAIGLAIAADEQSGFALADRFSRTFGVFRESEAGHEITFDPIFTSDSELPSRGDGPKTTRRSYNAAHNVGHFRFFECGGVDGDGRPRGDIALFGDALFPFDTALVDRDLSGVSVRRQDRGPLIEEEYRLDEHGIVEVKIRNVDAGYERAFRLSVRPPS